MSQHFIDEAMQHPRQAAGLLLQIARRHDVKLIIAERGDELELGMIRCKILHPVSGESCRSVNDQSIVAVFSRVQESRPSILMCGDAQDEALARVMHRYPLLKAEAMELPHHGSWRDIAVAFVEHVDPNHVLQSTGPSRFQLDRWSDVMNGRDRQVTVRDGAVSIELDPSNGCFRRTAVPRHSCRSHRLRAGTRSP